MPPLSEENEELGETTLPPQEIGKPQTGQPKNMRTLLSNLRKSKTVQEAEEAIKVLRDLTDDDTEATVKTATEIITKSNFGMALILLSLGKWYTESMKFSGTAIALLADITYSDENTKQVIVESGSLDIVMAAANKYPEDYMVRSNLLILLENITHNKDNMYHNDVTDDEHIDLVIKTMKDWTQDEDIQETGCGYFVNIMVIEETKLKLQEKKIGSLLMAAIENFQEHEEVRKQAKEALDIYTSSTDKAHGDDDDVDDNGQDEEEGENGEESFLLNEYEDDEDDIPVTDTATLQSLCA